MRDSFLGGAKILVLEDGWRRREACHWLWLIERGCGTPYRGMTLTLREEPVILLGSQREREPVFLLLCLGYLGSKDALMIRCSPWCQTRRFLCSFLLKQAGRRIGDGCDPFDGRVCGGRTKRGRASARVVDMEINSVGQKSTSESHRLAICSRGSSNR